MESASCVRVGTRKSELALFQANYVISLLQKQDPSLTFKVCEYLTTGDSILDHPLSEIGEKALFTKELETALLNNEVDLVVHSLKDLPTQLPTGLLISAMLEREEPNDVVILNSSHCALGRSALSDLEPGSIVGTSSIRRVTQLQMAYPGLFFLDIRGNINTRLKKLECTDTNQHYDAIILAYAGMKRLGYEHLISSKLHASTSLYAVGQGSIAIESRENDSRISTIVKNINHTQTEAQCKAERKLMNVLEGGCSIALGVHSQVIPSAMDKSYLYTLRAGVFGKSNPSENHLILSESATIQSGLDPSEQVRLATLLGEKLARKMIQHGASAILKS